MRNRLIGVLLTTACIFGAFGAGTSEVALAASGPTVVQTVPAVPGMRFSFHGTTLRADALGQVRVPATRDLQRELRVLPTTVSRGVRAGLDRWYPGRRIVTVAYFHRIRPRYLNLQGNEVDPKQVEAATVVGVHGGQYTFKGGEARWLQVSRVVPKLGGHLRSKSLQYTVQKVLVKGSNVVNIGQQRFRPAKTPVIPMQLLLYSARFKTSDAFFGFPIGSAVRIKYPSGRVERLKLGKNGELLVPSLPRSNYKVSVDGPGFSFERPVSLSRNQEIKLEVLSYLDVALALFVMAAFALGLPLIRRPGLRATLRHPVHAAQTRSWGLPLSNPEGRE